MEGRLTLCNMSIEAGGRCGMVAPDATTFAYLKGRPFAPKGADFDRAVEAWSALPSDADASFDREVSLDAGEIAPIVTWGTTPEDALPIDGTRSRSRAREPMRRAPNICARRSTIWGSRRATKLTDIAVDRVFIGSCTNARIEDLRAAAAVLSGRVSKVPGLVSPGSSSVKRQAEEEGLDQIFRDAGLEWAESGCSMCVGINGDLVPPGERCASTTNRNFRGRQGPGARTHLMSPAMVAAAAVTGHLADVRPSARRTKALEAPMDKFVRLTATACPLVAAESQHRPDSPGALSEMAARRRGSATCCSTTCASMPKASERRGFPAQRAGLARRARSCWPGAISAAAPRARPRSTRCTITASAASVAPSFGDIFCAECGEERAADRHRRGSGHREAGRRWCAQSRRAGHGRSRTADDRVRQPHPSRSRSIRSAASNCSMAGTTST